MVLISLQFSDSVIADGSSCSCQRANLLGRGRSTQSRPVFFCEHVKALFTPEFKQLISEYSKPLTDTP